MSLPERHQEEKTRAQIQSRHQRVFPGKTLTERQTELHQLSSPERNWQENSRAQPKQTSEEIRENKLELSTLKSDKIGAIRLSIIPTVTSSRQTLEKRL